jgi:hypothetical protein
MVHSRVPSIAIFVASAAVAVAGGCGEPRPEPRQLTLACERPTDGDLDVPRGFTRLQLPDDDASAREILDALCGSERAILKQHVDAALTFSLERRMAVEISLDIEEDETVVVVVAPADLCGGAADVRRCDIVRGSLHLTDDPYLDPGDYVVFLRSATLRSGRRVGIQLRAVAPPENTTCRTAEPLTLPTTIVVDPLGTTDVVDCSPPFSIVPSLYYEVALPAGHALAAPALMPLPIQSVVKTTCATTNCRGGGGAGLLAVGYETDPDTVVISVSALAPIEIPLEVLPLATNTTCDAATPLSLTSGRASVFGEFRLNMTTAPCSGVGTLEAASFYTVEVPPRSSALAEGNEGTVVVAYEGGCQSNCFAMDDGTWAVVDNPSDGPMTATFGISQQSAATFDLFITIDAIGP